MNKKDLARKYATAEKLIKIAVDISREETVAELEDELGKLWNVTNDFERVIRRMITARGYHDQ